METGKITVTVHLEKLVSPAKTLRANLARDLKRIQAAGLDLGKPVIAIKKLAPENWAESWKRHFKPIEIGKALLIKPSWSKRRERKGQAVVILDPGLSFGTGQHATTSFCLQQMVAYRKPSTRQTFLDVGSGSGILAICAAKLGYAPVEAFDFDPEAVRVSRENAAENKVEKVVKPTRKDLTQLPANSARKYDLICANLMYDLLISEAEKISQRLKPDGNLILAGILSTQFSMVQKAYKKLGLKLIATREEKEWQSGEFQWVK